MEFQAAQILHDEPPPAVYHMDLTEYCLPTSLALNYMKAFLLTQDRLCIFPPQSSDKSVLAAHSFSECCPAPWWDTWRHVNTPFLHQKSLLAIPNLLLKWLKSVWCLLWTKQVTLRCNNLLLEIKGFIFHQKKKKTWIFPQFLPY